MSEFFFKVGVLVRNFGLCWVKLFGDFDFAITRYRELESESADFVAHRSRVIEKAEPPFIQHLWDWGGGGTRRKLNSTLCTVDIRALSSTTPQHFGIFTSA